MKSKSLIAIAALVACSGAWAGGIEEFFIRLGLETLGGYAEGKQEWEKKKRFLAAEIGLMRYGPECDRLGGNTEGYCGEVSEGDLFDESMAFGLQAIEDFEQCWKEADKLPTGDETIDARGQCKYELEATERNYDAYRARLDSAS